MERGSKQFLFLLNFFSARSRILGSGRGARDCGSMGLSGSDWRRPCFRDEVVSDIITAPTPWTAAAFAEFASSDPLCLRPSLCSGDAISFSWAPCASNSIALFGLKYSGSPPDFWSLKRYLSVSGELPGCGEAPFVRSTLLTPGGLVSFELERVFLSGREALEVTGDRLVLVTVTLGRIHWERSPSHTHSDLTLSRLQ